MTVNVFDTVTFELFALFPLVLPRLRRDRHTAIVMARADGIRARRILRAVVAVTALVGGLTIALTPEERLFPLRYSVLTIVPGMVVLAFFAWLHRAVASLEADSVGRPAVLELRDERIPRTAWLIATPPLATIGLIVWLSSHWSGLPARHVDVQAANAWHDLNFQTIVQFLLFDVAWCVWYGLLGLAMWHGTSRQYAFRKSHLSFAIATAWSFTLLTPAFTLPVWLRLSPGGLLLCVLSGVTGVGLFLTFARRARREMAAAAMPPSSYRIYFDRDDPSFFGDRGLNAGSPWNWALFGACGLFALPPLLFLLLLR